MSAEDAVKKAISNILGINADLIGNNQRVMYEDLGADSLDAVEIVMEIEDILEIEISDEEWDKCVTVQNAIDLVNKELGK